MSNIYALAAYFDQPWINRIILNQHFSYLILFCSICTLLLSSGCRKDRFYKESGNVLRFSTDTLTFDTVFTTLGSTTKALKVFNDNKLSVKISEITLINQPDANFRLNIDGLPGNSAEDVVILPKDSIYIFVEVTVDPSNVDNPFIIANELEFLTNDSRQSVILSAWGQNANFYRSAEICDETWTNDKPYVLLDNTLVPPDCFLKIEEGVRVYVGPNSGFFVEGVLDVEGSLENPVTFQGLRLEEFYEDIPGQWPGISILRSDPPNVSTINHAEIKNANFGVSVGSAALDSSCRFPDVFTGNNAPGLIIENSIIKNSQQTGIAGFLSAINGKNLLVYNSGDYLLSLGFGGEYEFTHCTFANYGTATLNHRQPTAFMSNVAGIECEGETQVFPATLDAKFYNCIVYGSLDNEIEFGDVGQGVPFDVLFDHCLVKSELDTLPSFFPNTIFNQDPLFLDRSEDDFHLAANSPAIDSGTTNLPTAVPEDLDGVTRTTIPDIGCYEYQN